MIRILSQDPNEMVLDDGINFAFVCGVIFIGTGILAGGYLFSVIHSAPSEALTIFVSVGLGLFLVGIAFLFSASWLTLVIDKSRGQLSLYRKRLFKTRKEEYRVGDIERIEWRMEYENEKWNDAPAGSAFAIILKQNFLQAQPVFRAKEIIVFKNHELVLATDKGKRILAPVFTELAMPTLTQVASFLGVPLQEKSSDSSTNIH